MRKKFILPIFLFLIIIFVGCDKEEVENADFEITETPYILKFEKVIDYTTLEPSKGMMLGINFNRSMENDVLKYEQSLEKSPSHYVYEYILGTEFDDNYILESIAKNKILYIKLIPSKFNMYNIEEVEKVSEKIKSYNIDCYIELFPNPSTQDYDSEKYKEYFYKSSVILKSNIKNASIIFTPNSNELFSSADFVPDKDCYDFVGFEYVGNINITETEMFNNFYNKFIYIYETYSEEKPIFITTFALSYFSNKENTYYVNENIKFINDLFKDLSENYKRVKGVNFYDIDVKNSPFENKDYNNENYRLTENKKILDNFNTLISNSYFNSEFEQNGQYEKSSALYDALLVDDVYFVSEKVFNNSDIIKMNEKEKFNSYNFGENVYYKMDDLFKNVESYSIDINNSNKIIKLNLTK